MRLITGLGNIGARYDLTRHNIGFMALDRYAEKNNLKISRIGFSGRHCVFLAGKERVVLLKPSTYMNLSGRSVKAAARYYGVSEADILIIHDDVDFELGTIKLRATGSGGTHNGMKSVIEMMGSQAIPRIRMGIGKPPPNIPLADFVLSKFTRKELETVKGSVEAACLAIDTFIASGIDEAMNAHNKRT